MHPFIDGDGLSRPDILEGSILEERRVIAYTWVLLVKRGMAPIPTGMYGNILTSLHAPCTAAPSTAVLKAHRLKDTSTFGKQNIYLKLTAGSNTRTSSVHQGRCLAGKPCNLVRGQDQASLDAPKQSISLCQRLHVGLRLWHNSSWCQLRVTLVGSCFQ